jgi:hypothetical protein
MGNSSSSDMVITCGKAVRQAHSRNLMLFLLAPYSTNTPVHGLMYHFPFNWLIYCYTSVSILKEEGINRGCSYIWGKAIAQHSLSVFHLQLSNLALWCIQSTYQKNSYSHQLECWNASESGQVFTGLRNKVSFIVSLTVVLKSLQIWSGI